MGRNDLVPDCVAYRLVISDINVNKSLVILYRLKYMYRIKSSSSSFEITFVNISDMS